MASPCPEDKVIERLNKLLKHAQAVSSSLSTASYILYLLACLRGEDTPIKDNIHNFIDGDLSTIRTRREKIARQSSVAALAELLYKTRSILRLFQVIPQLDELRRLLLRPDKDRYLWATKLIESSLFATHYFVESFATLVEYQMLPRRILDRIKGMDSTALYATAYRIWFLGISCTFIRRYKKKTSGKSKFESSTINARQPTSQPDTTFNGKHGNNETHIAAESTHVTHPDPLLLLCWLPVGWTLSGWCEYEVPGLHMMLYCFGDGLLELGVRVAEFIKVPSL